MGIDQRGLFIMGEWERGSSGEIRNGKHGEMGNGIRQKLNSFLCPGMAGRGLGYHCCTSALLLCVVYLVVDDYDRGLGRVGARWWTRYRGGFARNYYWCRRGGGWSHICVCIL